MLSVEKWHYNVDVGGVSPFLRQEVPHELPDRVREPAGGGVRRQLQEGVPHHLQPPRHQRHRRRLHDAAHKG